MEGMTNFIISGLCTFSAIYGETEILKALNAALAVVNFGFGIRSAMKD